MSSEFGIQLMLQSHSKEELAEMVCDLQAEREEAKEFHPRAMKLIQKRKNFIVVADDEPYYFWVYSKIREHEKEIGRWTDDEDERAYQNARDDYYMWRE